MFNGSDAEGGPSFELESLEIDQKALKKDVRGSDKPERNYTNCRLPPVSKNSINGKNSSSRAFLHTLFSNIIF
jgi:hypothetical protein